MIVGCHVPTFVEVRLQQQYDDLVGDAFIPGVSFVSTTVPKPIYHILTLFAHS